jgi:hypothetical protein
VIWSTSDVEVLREIAVSSSRPARTRTMSKTLGFVVQTLTVEQDSQPLCCPDCLLQFNLIQPDENDPSRMLGTCDGCSKWVYLVELEPDWRESMMVELPTGKVLHKELAKPEPSALG